jgi:hypothetical protein
LIYAWLDWHAWTTRKKVTKQDKRHGRWRASCFRALSPRLPKTGAHPDKVNTS